MPSFRRVSDLAQALVSVAHEEKAVARIVTDLHLLQEALHINPALLSDLSERSVAQKRRVQALEAALKTQLHPFTLNALRTLLELDLLQELPSFVTAVLAEARKQANHHDVRVTSATELSEKERDILTKVIQRKFGGTHTVSQRIDPSILGGLIIDVGDWHVDASLTGKIARLTNALTA
jgi:F-type H+-transporting ATPase subunit delta